jgi:hypothetical protein
MEKSDPTVTLESDPLSSPKTQDVEAGGVGGNTPNGGQSDSVNTLPNLETSDGIIVGSIKDEFIEKIKKRSPLPLDDERAQLEHLKKVAEKLDRLLGKKTDKNFFWHD